MTVLRWLWRHKWHILTLGVGLLLGRLFRRSRRRWWGRDDALVREAEKKAEEKRRKKEALKKAIERIRDERRKAISGTLSGARSRPGGRAVLGERLTDRPEVRRRKR